MTNKVYTMGVRRPDLLESGISRGALQQLHEGPYRDVVTLLPRSLPLRGTAVICNTDRVGVILSGSGIAVAVAGTYHYTHIHTTHAYILLPGATGLLA